jgi:hypothetical protein
MRKCKAKLRHPVTGKVLLTCDLDDVTHAWHSDKVTGADWKEPSVLAITKMSDVKVPPRKAEVCA